jgi:hypothetical protein
VVLFASVVAGLLLIAFAVTPYLPMVDLPQHTAQVSIWRWLGDPSFAGAGQFTLNLGTPYLTAYAAARFLGDVVGVLAAWKLVVWASIVLHQIAFGRLVRKLGYAECLALLGIPLGLGYPFYYGLVSFVASVPLVLFCLVAALEHRDRAALGSGATLAAWLCLTLVTHGFTVGVAMVMTAPLLLRGSGRLVARLAPLLAPLLLWAVWFMPARAVRSIGLTIWDPRLLDLLGAPALWFASSAADRVALAFGYAALALVIVALGRPLRSPERWIPLALMLAGFCLFPAMMSGFGPLHPRFAAFFLPALLLAFEPHPAPRWSKLPGVSFALVVVWFATFAVRLRAFTKETEPLRNLIARMPDGLRVRPVVFERNSDSFPGLPALLHLPAYYTSEKRGLEGYSFAMYPTSVIRYADRVRPAMTGGSEWHPEWFSAAELANYDSVIVHGAMDRTDELFGDRAEDTTVAFHEGDWWEYRVGRHP